MKKFLLALLVLVCIAVGGLMVVFRLYKLPSGSMLPTLEPDGFFLLNRFAYRSSPPKRGDIVVFRAPGTKDRELVKRVIGVAGDRVAIRKKIVWLNGKALPRKRVPGPCTFSEEGKTRRCVAYDEQVDGHSYRIILTKKATLGAKEQKVPPGFVYVLGDNRDNSFDSRTFGSIVAGSIRGRVWE